MCQGAVLDQIDLDLLLSWYISRNVMPVARSSFHEHHRLDCLFPFQLQLQFTVFIEHLQ